MPTDTPQFTGSIPSNYDRFLVPILFQGYAESLAARVSDLKPQRVLELACGTGAVTRVIARLLPPEAEIVATDFSQAMLDHAQSVSTDIPNVRWHAADACSLPFEDKSFDCVVCQFGVMFFPDKHAAMKEALRVLSPGGNLIFNSWGSANVNPIFQTIEETLTAMFPEEETPFMPTPVSLPEPEMLTALALAGGFSTAEAESERHRVGPVAPSDLATGFTHGTPLGNYLREQGYDLPAIHSGLVQAFATRMSDPMHCDLEAIVCQAKKGN